MHHADWRTLVLRRLLPALFGALLGLGATSPEFVIEMNNWLFWLGARILTAAFPELFP